MPQADPNKEQEHKLPNSEVALAALAVDNEQDEPAVQELLVQLLHDQHDKHMSNDPVPVHANRRSMGWISLALGADATPIVQTAYSIALTLNQLGQQTFYGLSVRSDLVEDGAMQRLFIVRLYA